MKNYFAIIIDSFLCSIISFILLKILFSLFLSNTLSICFALICSIALFLVFLRIFLSKRDFNFLKIKEQKQANLTLSQLPFLKKEEIVSLFFSVFTKLDENPKKQGNKIFLPLKNSFVFFLFSFDDIQKSQIIKIYNSLYEKQSAIILTKDYSPEIEKFCQKFNGKIRLYNGEKVYYLLKKADIFPQNKILFFEDKKEKLNFFNLFNKKRAKNYFFFGIIFMLYSFIVPLKLYYIIVGSLFLILSLSCFLFGKDNTPSPYF